MQQSNTKETKLKQDVFANRDFLNATSLDDAKQKLTNQLIYARRNLIFSGEFSRNLNPKDIKSWLFKF